MKKIIVCAFALAVAIQGINAQDAQAEKKEGFRNRSHRESFHNLNLTEEQKAKFKSLNDDFRKQMDDLKKKDDITVKEWRSRMETLHKDHRAKMQGMLTTEQKAQLEKQRTERKERQKKEGEARMDRMKTRLSLTDDQVARLKQNRSEMSEKMKTIRENKALTDEQKHDQFEELRKKNKDGLKDILTEEQMKRLHEKQTRRSAKQPV
jgi:periplasmic protein CpxP/Spy